MGISSSSHTTLSTAIFPPLARTSHPPSEKEHPCRGHLPSCAPAPGSSSSPAAAMHPFPWERRIVIHGGADSRPHWIPEGLLTGPWWRLRGACLRSGLLAPSPASTQHCPHYAGPRARKSGVLSSHWLRTARSSPAPKTGRFPSFACATALSSGARL